MADYRLILSDGLGNRVDFEVSGNEAAAQAMNTAKDLFRVFGYGKILLVDSNNQIIWTWNATEEE